MKRQEGARLARMTLDFRFEQGGPDALAPRPARGWIRAIRDALGMTSRQLADRMGVSQPAVAQLERSEVAGRVRLDSLHRAAAAMDCDVVYALVPRTSLDETVAARARDVARRDIATIDLTMRLDDQGLDAADLKRRTDEYAGHLIATGRLWDETERP